MVVLPGVHSASALNLSSNCIKALLSSKLVVYVQPGLEAAEQNINTAGDFPPTEALKQNDTHECHQQSVVGQDEDVHRIVCLRH